MPEDQLAAHSVTVYTSHSRLCPFISIFTIFSVFFTVYYLYSESRYIDPHGDHFYSNTFHYAFFIYQGVLIDPLFIFAYVNLYLRLSFFHAQTIHRFRSVYSPEEINKIHASTREARNFFFFIVLMLILQTGHLFVKPFAQFYRDYDTLLTDRVNDVSIILLQVSHIMMNIGVSLSIKKAFVAQVKKVRNKKLKKASTFMASVPQSAETRYQSNLVATKSLLEEITENED